MKHLKSGNMLLKVYQGERTVFPKVDAPDLAYVFINDTFLNEQLVRQGFCEVTIYKKRAKLKYQDELLNAQNQAKQEKLGKWK